jgi:hypothetical protein
VVIHEDVGTNEAPDISPVSAPILRLFAKFAEQSRGKEKAERSLPGAEQVVWRSSTGGVTNAICDPVSNVISLMEWVHANESGRGMPGKKSRKLVQKCLPCGERK